MAGLTADTLVDFLYLFAAMRRLNIPDPQSKLGNAALLAPDVGSLLRQQPALIGVLGEAADELNARPAALRAVAADAEQWLSRERLHQLGGVVTSHAARWVGEPTAGVRLALLAALADELIEGTVEFPSSAFTDDPAGQPRLVRAAEALQRLLVTIAGYSTRIAGVGNAASADLDALVDRYTGGLANVELDMIEARRDLQVAAVALGPHEKLAARIVALAAAAEEAVAAYDAQLEHILHVTPDAILSSSRAVHRFLPAHLIPQIEVNSDLRVWLLVFDALRWDLWARVLRPEFEAAGWACQVEAGLALLPSETYFSRRSLLGGVSPVTWAGSSGATEESLARRFLHPYFPNTSDIVFRLKAQQGNDYDLGPPPAGKANVWVFQTPDQQVHHAGDSLRDIAEQFRTYLRANVMPELQAEIGSDDLVFVATDHGFTRISGENTHTVSLPRERVDYRYLTLADSDNPAGIPGVDVVYPGLGRYRVATGNVAFIALGGSAPASGFRHGGATMRELVVPVVELHRQVTKATGFSLSCRVLPRLTKTPRCRTSCI